MSTFASASVRFAAKMPTTWPCLNAIGGRVCSNVTSKPARRLLQNRHADGLVAALDVRALALERHLLLGAATDGKLTRLEAGAMHVEAFVLFRADVAEALHGVEPEHLPSHRRMPSTRGRAHCPLRTPSLAGPTRNPAPGQPLASAA